MMMMLVYTLFFPCAWISSVNHCRIPARFPFPLRIFCVRIPCKLHPITFWDGPNHPNSHHTSLIRSSAGAACCIKINENRRPLFLGHLTIKGAAVYRANNGLPPNETSGVLPVKHREPAPARSCGETTLVCGFPVFVCVFRHHPRAPRSLCLSRSNHPKR